MYFYHFTLIISFSHTFSFLLTPIHSSSPPMKGKRKIAQGCQRKRSAEENAHHQAKPTGTERRGADIIMWSVVWWDEMRCDVTWYGVVHRSVVHRSVVRFDEMRCSEIVCCVVCERISWWDLPILLSASSCLLSLFPTYPDLLFLFRPLFSFLPILSNEGQMN